ncbi:hypothetical protein PLUTE_b0758 [Pseudoalteromonas luteoviolacea DSM 6061]|nr:hypothetical protein [Pseudoalteromonas luteoviolacea DSM 6061]
MPVATYWQIRGKQISGSALVGSQSCCLAAMYQKVASTFKKAVNLSPFYNASK